MSKERANGHGADEESRVGEEAARALDEQGVLTVKDIMSSAGGRGDGDSDYVETVLQTTVAKEYLDQLGTEFDPANALSYREEGYLHEAVEMIRFRTDQFFHENPPPNSKLQGGYRELVYGERRTPLSPKEYRVVQAIEHILIARVLMSKDMELQRIIKEMRVEQNRTLEERRTEGRRRSGDGGLGEKLGLR